MTTKILVPSEGCVWVDMIPGASPLTPLVPEVLYHKAPRDQKEGSLACTETGKQ